jgi:two-component system NtrC family sensor kinase
MHTTRAPKLSTPTNRRILLVDDLASIHEDFRKISPPAAATDVDADEAVLFGEPTSTASVRFETDSAFQGAEALEKVRASLLAGSPYAMAFLDMRMPPGWDGVEYRVPQKSRNHLASAQDRLATEALSC